MESTENSLYALLIGISKDVGEIKSDVKNVQANVENYNDESMKADEKVANKLEEYFESTKIRQDDIKAELETKIGNVRADLKGVSDRVDVLENMPKTRVWNIILQFKSVLITAIIAAIVAGMMKCSTNIITTLSSQPNFFIEKPLHPEGERR